MKEASIKFVFTGITAVISAYLGWIAVPLAILTLTMICDYATGIAAAWIKNSLSSRVGIVGIVKKVCYLATVGVGVTADWVISTAFSSETDMHLFGLLVTVWLVINELISILENLSKIGVPMPKFLTTLIEHLSSAVESKGENEQK